jgi:hypothetical protein
VRAWVDNGQPFPDGVTGFIDKVEQARSVFAALGWPEPEPGSAPEPSVTPESEDEDPGAEREPVPP